MYGWLPSLFTWNYHSIVNRLYSTTKQKVQNIKCYLLFKKKKKEILSCATGINLDWGFSSVQSLSRVQLFATPWSAARQASLSITISRSSLRLTCIESVMPSSHLILCRPLLLLPPIPPSIRDFSNESTLRMRCPKYWSFSFSISPFNEYSGLFPLGLTGLISLLSKRLSRVFSNTTVQKHQCFSAQLSI